MEKIRLQRTFKYTRNGKTTELPDPDGDMSPSEVLDFYSNTYPELVNGRMEGPSYTEDGKMEYTIRTTIGTKG